MPIYIILDTNQINCQEKIAKIAQTLVLITKSNNIYILNKGVIMFTNNTSI